MLVDSKDYLKTQIGVLTNGSEFLSYCVMGEYPQPFNSQPTTQSQLRHSGGLPRFPNFLLYVKNAVTNSLENCDW